MESLEMSAKTVEEAIQLALEKLNVSREKVEVAVIKEGKPGILGLGGEEAVVRVTPLENGPAEEVDISDRAEEILENLLAAMGVQASVVVNVEPGGEKGVAGSVTLDIIGDDLGILIGRWGQTLASLQYMVRLILAHQLKAWLPVTIDVEGYKQRRFEALQNLAYRLAEQVQIEKAPFTLETMPAYERRIIHMTLAEHPKVTTRSIGMGESRRVVIEPSGYVAQP